MNRVVLSVVFIGIITLTSGCKKNNSVTVTVPSLSTSTITGITYSTATSGGNISSDGNAAVTARGVCWNTVTGPTTSDSHTSDGTGTGNFISSLTGLTASTPYFVRAYATNTAGTAYGNEVTFTTSAAQAANEVLIQGMAYSPLSLTVAVNTTVKWTNNDNVSHSVTSDTGLFDSGLFGNGGTYSRQFTTAGTFNYHCSIHPYMTATIIVQ